MAFITLKNTTFTAKVLESKQPVLVEFFAEWSGAHHIISPGLREMSERYGTHVKFCRIDVDSYGELAKEYGVQSIPTILLFKDGEVVEQIAGMVPKTDIAEKLEALFEEE